MIELRNVEKKFGDNVVAVNDLSLVVRDSEFVCLVGPSGCGKTTTLRMINRLTEPSAGSILIDGSDVLSVNPQKLRRGIGYVIQQVGLFSHETIMANAEAVPRLLRWGKARREDRARELLALVGLDPDEYGSRYPDQLSGGQRQRVGVARALAADPPVLLMDEPFSAIDPIARRNLQQAFLDIQRKLRKTIVMVTHDVDEAILMADRIALLSEGGKLEQFGPPTELLGNPANTFVSSFMGGAPILRSFGVRRLRPTDLVRVPTRVVGDGVEAVQAGAQAPDITTLTVLVDRSGRPVGWRATRSDGSDSLAVGGTSDELTISLESSLLDVTSLLIRNPAGFVIVVDKGSGTYLGVVTFDALRAAARADSLGLNASSNERPVTHRSLNMGGN